MEWGHRPSSRVSASPPNPPSECSDCPVRTECLAAALEDPFTAGVWGAVSQQGRRVLRRIADGSFRPWTHGGWRGRFMDAPGAL